MALIVCGECGNQVSDKASACPKCGAPVVASQQLVASAASPASVTHGKTRFFTVGRALVWLFILFGGTLLFRLATGSSLVGAIAGPRSIVDERIELKEGEAQSYGFRLQQSVNVEVEVSATPKQVNIMLMSEDQWARYQKVHGSLWGGAFEYKKALSREHVLDWKGSERLPVGSWRVVIERPRESLLFGDSTAARVKVLVH